MFAAYTPTRRMKGSGVVQSLKSLASKLHPGGLPLSNKESQRLLTALTTSFRQHLDKAYPARVGAEDPQALNKDAVQPRAELPGTRIFHASSVEAADKHLASVLTSPLLTRSYGSATFHLDYNTAQKSFLENPWQDPAHLLEEYHKHGAANLRIAALCLEKFNERLDRLNTQERAKLVSDLQVGSRVLWWLLHSDPVSKNAFVDDKRFMHALVFAVMEEGQEQLLWDLTQTDIALGVQDPKDPKLGVEHYRYRWRGRVLSCMVEHKLDTSTNASADAALELLFRALESPVHYPLGQSNVVLRGAFDHEMDTIYASTTPALYDRYISVQHQIISSAATLRLEVALLYLYHPHKANPWPFLKLLVACLDTEYASKDKTWEEKTLEARFERPYSESIRNGWTKHMVNLAALLQVQGAVKEMDWVVSQIMRLHPSFNEGRIARGVQNYHRRLDHALERSTAPRKTERPFDIKPQAVPFPTFA